jgi:hypothetical protein
MRWDHEVKLPPSCMGRADPAGIGWDLPCPLVLLNEGEWPFPQDQEEYVKGPSAWREQVRLCAS